MKTQRRIKWNETNDGMLIVSLYWLKMRIESFTRVFSLDNHKSIKSYVYLDDSVSSYGVRFHKKLMTWCETWQFQKDDSLWRKMVHCSVNKESDNWNYHVTLSLCFFNNNSVMIIFLKLFWARILASLSCSFHILLSDDQW